MERREAKAVLWQIDVSHRTTFSGGARHGRVRCTGVRERTQRPLSLSAGFVVSMYRHHLLS